MAHKARYLTLLKFCKNCSANIPYNSAAFRPSKATRCPSCGSQDRMKFKRSK